MRPLSWSESHIKEEFYGTISSPDPFALRSLWHRKEWRQELGNVLLTILRALCQTDYDASQEEFYALWMPSKHRRPRRVVLKESDHSWVRLLRDSEDSCAMTVVIQKCLGIVSDVEGPQMCQHQ